MPSLPDMTTPDVDALARAAAAQARPATPEPTPRPISAGPLRPFLPGMSPSTRTSEGPTAAAARAA